MLIHRTAIVHPEAHLEPGVEIGAYSIIGKGSLIESDTRIGSHVVIGENVTIGPGCEIHSHCVIGSDPQDLKYDGAPSFVEIGEGCKIREFVTINRGSGKGSVTRVGARTLLMTGVHIAHDCQIGKEVIMANLATLGGHCIVEDNAVMGGFSVAHQFVRVGQLAMVGGTSGLMQDAPPYMMVFGPAPARVININHIGLKRKGIPPEIRMHLRQAFHFLYRQGLTIEDALRKIEEEIPQSEPIQNLIRFYRSSQRGICRATLAVTEPQEEKFREDYFDEFTTSIPAT